MKTPRIANAIGLIDDDLVSGAAGSKKKKKNYYKVLLNDLRISRYVDYGAVTVGDTVQISYEGEIEKENGNIIDSAVSASKAVISGGDVMIPE